jgi:hypothetical protein
MNKSRIGEKNPMWGKKRPDTRNKDLEVVLNE